MDLALVGGSVLLHCRGYRTRGSKRSLLGGSGRSLFFRSCSSFLLAHVVLRTNTNNNVSVPRTKEVRLAISTGEVGKSSPSPGQVRRITVQFGTISVRAGPCPGPNPTTSGPPSDCWQQQVAEDQGAEPRLRGRSARAAAPKAAAAADPHQRPGDSKQQARQSTPERQPTDPPFHVHYVHQNVHGPCQQWALWPTFPTRASAGAAPGRRADGVWCRRVRRHTAAATTGCHRRAPRGAAPGRRDAGRWRRRGVRKRTAATGCQRHRVLPSLRQDAGGGAELGSHLGGIPCSTGGWVDADGGGNIGFGRVSLCCMLPIFCVDLLAVPPNEHIFKVCCFRYQ